MIMLHARIGCWTSCCRKENLFALLYGLPGLCDANSSSLPAQILNLKFHKPSSTAGDNQGLRARHCKARKASEKVQASKPLSKLNIPSHGIPSPDMLFQPVNACWQAGRSTEYVLPLLLGPTEAE